MNYRQTGVPFVLGAGTAFDFLTGSGRPQNGEVKNFWKFIRAVLWQRWRLRSKKTVAPAAANVIPDPYGNFIIRAPAELGGSRRCDGTGRMVAGG